MKRCVDILIYGNGEGMPNNDTYFVFQPQVASAFDWIDLKAWLKDMFGIVEKWNLVRVDDDEVQYQGKFKNGDIFVTASLYDVDNNDSTHWVFDGLGNINRIPFDSEI